MSVRTFKWASVVVLAIFAIEGAYVLYSAFHPPPVKCKPDAWLNPVPNFRDWEKLGPAHLREVPDGSRERAMEMLEAVESVELTPEDVEATFPDWKEEHPGRKPYLVRVLKFDAPACTFLCSTRDEAVWIRHAGMGRRWPPVVRSALVVWLPFAPRAVYLDYGMTE
jgi:hypothetical protein